LGGNQGETWGTEAEMSERSANLGQGRSEVAITVVGIVGGTSLKNRVEAEQKGFKRALETFGVSIVGES